jgi:hypothetical protein
MVIDAIHACNELDIEYPKEEAEQRRIAEGFRLISETDFDICAGCIDGILVWTEKPSRDECDVMKVGEKRFMCGRKGKFGFNLQAVCDSRGPFLEVRPPPCGGIGLFFSDQFNVVRQEERDSDIPGDLFTKANTSEDVGPADIKGERSIPRARLMNMVSNSGLHLSKMSVDCFCIT